MAAQQPSKSDPTPAKTDRESYRTPQESSSTQQAKLTPNAEEEPPSEEHAKAEQHSNAAKCGSQTKHTATNANASNATAGTSNAHRPMAAKSASTANMATTSASASATIHHPSVQSRASTRRSLQQPGSHATRQGLSGIREDLRCEIGDECTQAAQCNIYHNHHHNLRFTVHTQHARRNTKQPRTREQHSKRTTCKSSRTVQHIVLRGKTPTVQRVASVATTGPMPSKRGVNQHQQCINKWMLHSHMDPHQ